MIEGRDTQGRFTTNYAPDRGRGGAPVRQLPILDEEMRRIVMETANLAVSIPRGRGRRIVTLYEALFRKLASGRIRQRTAIVDFMRLVREAAAMTPAPEPAPERPMFLATLHDQLDELRVAIASGKADEFDRRTVVFYEVLLGTLKRRRA